MLKIYKKTEIKHFSLETGPVDFEAEMPSGIGILDENSQIPKKTERGKVVEDILVDPMTKEVISTEAKVVGKSSSIVNRGVSSPQLQARKHRQTAP